jgi:hypothetical protein
MESKDSSFEPSLAGTSVDEFVRLGRGFHAAYNSKFVCEFRPPWSVDLIVNEWLRILAASCCTHFGFRPLVSKGRLHGANLTRGYFQSRKMFVIRANPELHAQ